MQKLLWSVMVVVYLGGVPAFGASVAGVRPLSDRGARLVAAARAVSPTIAQMLARIEASDIILQLDVRPSFDVRHAVTRLVTATDGYRYVRISINPRMSAARLVELFAHELQHVLEIAADPTVRSQGEMRDYFAAIGDWSPSSGGFETDAAVRVERVVRAEVGRHAGRRLSDRLKWAP